MASLGWVVFVNRASPHANHALNHKPTVRDVTSMQLSQFCWALNAMMSVQVAS